MGEYQSLVTQAAMISTAAASLKDQLPKDIDWLARNCFPQKVDVKLGEIRDKLLAAKNIGVEDLQEFDFDKVPAEIQADLVSMIKAFRHLDMADWIVFMVEGTLEKLGVPEHYYKSAPVEKAKPTSSAVPAK